MMNAKGAIDAQKAALELLIFVDGIFDVAFLQRISHVLHKEIPEVPDLAVLSEKRRVAIIALNGGPTCTTTNAFAPIGPAEFHLDARKSLSEAERRVNRRKRSRKPDIFGYPFGQDTFRSMMPWWPRKETTPPDATTPAPKRAG